MDENPGIGLFSARPKIAILHDYGVGVKFYPSKYSMYSYG